MSLAQPQRAWRYAALTTAASVAGGMCGERMDRLLRTYIDRLGWLFVILAVVLYLVVTTK